MSVEINSYADLMQVPDGSRLDVDGDEWVLRNSFIHRGENRLPMNFLEGMADSGRVRVLDESSVTEQSMQVGSTYFRPGELGQYLCVKVTAEGVATLVRFNNQTFAGLTFVGPGDDGAYQEIDEVSFGASKARMVSLGQAMSSTTPRVDVRSLRRTLRNHIPDASHTALDAGLEAAGFEVRDQTVVVEVQTRGMGNARLEPADLARGARHGVAPAEGVSVSFPAEQTLRLEVTTTAGECGCSEVTSQRVRDATSLNVLEFWRIECDQCGGVEEDLVPF